MMQSAKKTGTQLATTNTAAGLGIVLDRTYTHLELQCFAVPLSLAALRTIEVLAELLTAKTREIKAFLRANWHRVGLGSCRLSCYQSESRFSLYSQSYEADGVKPLTCYF